MPSLPKVPYRVVPDAIMLVGLLAVIWFQLELSHFQMPAFSEVSVQG